MKLLQLNVTANWGSTGRIAEGIGSAAIARGWESVIAYGRYKNPSRSRLIKVGNQLDVYAHYAKACLFDGEGLGSRRATKRLLNQIEHLSPDIIHLHNIHDHWLNYPILFEYLASVDVPIVWTFHDCWAFTGGCAYFDLQSCERWETECSNCPLRNNKIDRSRAQFIIRKELIASLSDRITIIPVSHWLEKYCRQSILNQCKITLIHNGIDTEAFRFDNHRANKLTILGVANVWNNRKGLIDFFKLRSLIPEDYADIVLVGLSESQIQALPKGIRGLSKTQNINDLVNIYCQSAVLVNPTYADNFPTVNLEALACGTPVVTYRTGGSPEAIDENTGLVVEKGDVNGLAHAVQYVLDNPERFSRETCRNRAVENFNKDTQFDKYISLYDRILRK